MGCLLSVFIKIDILVHFVVECKSKSELLFIEKICAFPPTNIFINIKIVDLCWSFSAT